MSSYLVDARVVAELLVIGNDTPHVRNFFQRIVIGDTFTTPQLCLDECTNVIWKAVRHRGMPVAQANQALRDLKSLKLKIVSTRPVMGMSLTIGIKHNLPVYDSLYIALAIRNRLDLVTIDAKQSRVATAEGVNVIPIASFSE